MEKKIPTHVAIIMDGNGRWATQQGKERYEGHIEGVASVRACIKAARRNGVRYLTLYAFSTENWGRPQEEVEALMQLFCRSVTNETPELVKEGVRVRFIGRRDRFSEEVRERLLHIEQSTAVGDKLTLVLAFDYSSRDEIMRATRELAERVAKGELQSGDITEQSISESLYTADMPDPDFIIRTSGECRLSNFLLWQASYAEMYFPQTLWPDFREEEFDRAMEVYAERDRRYGVL
jgi:undecaprenyl diphosphate synthase